MSQNICSRFSSDQLVRIKLVSIRKPFPENGCHVCKQVWFAITKSSLGFSTETLNDTYCALRFILQWHTVHSHCHPLIIFTPRNLLFLTDNDCASLYTLTETYCTTLMLTVHPQAHTVRHYSSPQTSTIPHRYSLQMYTGNLQLKFDNNQNTSHLQPKFSKELPEKTHYGIISVMDFAFEHTRFFYKLLLSLYLLLSPIGKGYSNGRQ